MHPASILQFSNVFIEFKIHSVLSIILQVSLFYFQMLQYKWIINWTEQKGRLFGAL